MHWRTITRGWYLEYLDDEGTPAAVAYYDISRQVWIGALLKTAERPRVARAFSGEGDAVAWVESRYAEVMYDPPEGIRLKGETELERETR